MRHDHDDVRRCLSCVRNSIGRRSGRILLCASTAGPANDRVHITQLGNWSHPLLLGIAEVRASLVFEKLREACGMGAVAAVSHALFMPLRLAFDLGALSSRRRHVK
eukprot:612494-Amphidinium_carterae.2